MLEYLLLEQKLLVCLAPLSLWDLGSKSFLNDISSVQSLLVQQSFLIVKE